MLEKNLIDTDRNQFVFNSFNVTMSHEGKSQEEAITALHIKNKKMINKKTQNYDKCTSYNTVSYVKKNTSSDL